MRLTSTVAVASACLSSLVVASYSKLYALVSYDPSETPQIFGPISIDLSTVGISYGANVTYKPTAYCNAAFNGFTRGVQSYYLESVGNVLALDANSGKVTANVTVSSQFNLDTITFDYHSHNILALGWPDAITGNYSAVAVDVSSGQLSVLDSLLAPHQGTLPCISSLGLSGVYYYTQDLPGLRSNIGGFNTTSHSQVYDSEYVGTGGIVALAAYAYTPANASSAGEEHLLVVDIFGGRGPQVNDVDPATGTVRILITLDDAYLFDSEGAAAWDADRRLLYLVLTQQSSGASDLVAVHVPLDPTLPVTANATRLKLDPSVQGVYALNLL